MAMTVTAIENLIRDAFPDAQIVVTDTVDDSEHFAARIVSSAFVGKTRLQQHQLVYDALRTPLAGALHALSLQTAIATE